MDRFLADGGSFINEANAINLPKKINNITSSASPETIQTAASMQDFFLDIAKLGEFLMGNAQILATIVAVGFTIYTFVLGMKVSRLALKLILKKEIVVLKFGASLFLIGVLSALSSLQYAKYPTDAILFLFLITLAAYALPAYWLVRLSQSLSSYLSPDTIVKLIRENLLKALEKGYKTETSQLRIKERFETVCERAAIDIIPGFVSLYDGENQTAVRPNKSGYINNFDLGKIERIGQLLNPIVISQSIEESTPSELRERQKNKVRIFQSIGSYIDPTSLNQTLSTVASVDNNAENKKEIVSLLSSLFEVNSKNKLATEINDLLIDLKNHILQTVRDRNLDEYENNILIFRELLKEHYKQSQNDENKQSLSYLNPIREIVAELLEDTLKIKNPQWTRNTIGLFYSMLSLTIENNDNALFQQFVTLLRTMYNLSREYDLKESAWTSHHLFYEMLNYHLIPKLEKDLKTADDVEKKANSINNTKRFIWSIFIILSENLKRAYQLDDVSYTTSVIKMLKGSLKYLGEYGDSAELIELKNWYKESLIKLWFNQLGYAFVLHDKKNKSNKSIFDQLLFATQEYSLEELSAVATSSNRGRNDDNFNFPDFMEVMFDEEAEYSGTAVFMGDPYVSSFKAYVVSGISRDSLDNQKSVPISEYFHGEMKTITDIFKSDSYKALTGDPKTNTIKAFEDINQVAYDEYKTQTEQSIIDAPLDESLVGRFKENALRGWNSNSSLRFLLKSHRKVVKKLTELPNATGNIVLRGFNQRHSKEYFIAQDRFGYPKDYGYEYGKALSEGEDLIIYEQLLKSANNKTLEVTSKNAEEIIEEVLNEVEPKNGTVLFIPFDFWEFHYRNSKKFVPRYSLPKNNKLNELRSFVGYFKYNGLQIPMIYSPERKRKDNKLLIANLISAGKLTIYKPTAETEKGIEIYAAIVPFSDNDIKQVIKAKPSDLVGLSEDNKIRKLQQEVALKVLERYSFEVISSDSIRVFTLNGIKESY